MMFRSKVLLCLLLIGCLSNTPLPTESTTVDDAVKAIIEGVIQEMFGEPMIESTTFFNETTGSQATSKSYTRLLENGELPKDEADFAYKYEEHFLSKMEKANNISIRDIKQCIMCGLNVYGVSIFQLSSLIAESLQKYSNVFFNMPNELSIIPLPSTSSKLTRHLRYSDKSDIWAQIDYKNLFLMLGHVTMSSLESSVAEVKQNELLSVAAKCRADKIDLCGEYVYTSYNQSSAFESFNGSICHRFWNVSYSSRYDKFMNFVNFKTIKLKEDISFDLEDYPPTDVSSCDSYDKFDPLCWTLFKRVHREGLWRQMSANYTHLLVRHMRAIVETHKDYPTLHGNFVEAYRRKITVILLKFIALYLRKANDVVTVSTDDGIEIVFENLSKFSDFLPTSKLAYVMSTGKGEEVRLESFAAFPRGYLVGFSTFAPTLATAKHVDCDVGVTVRYNGGSEPPVDKATITYGRNGKRYDIAEVKLRFTARLENVFDGEIENVEFDFTNEIIPIEVKRNIRSTVEKKLTKLLQSSFNESCPTSL